MCVCVRARVCVCVCVCVHACVHACMYTRLSVVVTQAILILTLFACVLCCETCVCSVWVQHLFSEHLSGGSICSVSICLGGAFVQWAFVWGSICLVSICPTVRGNMLKYFMMVTDHLYWAEKHQVQPTHGTVCLRRRVTISHFVSALRRRGAYWWLEQSLATPQTPLVSKLAAPFHLQYVFVITVLSCIWFPHADWIMTASIRDVLYFYIYIFVFIYWFDWTTQVEVGTVSPLAWVALCRKYLSLYITSWLTWKITSFGLSTCPWQELEYCIFFLSSFLLSLSPSLLLFLLISHLSPSLPLFPATQQMW